MYNYYVVPNIFELTNENLKFLGEQDSEVLLTVELDRLADSKCGEYYKVEQKFSKGYDAKTMMCAGHLTEAKDSCKVKEHKFSQSCS